MRSRRSTDTAHGTRCASRWSGRGGSPPGTAASRPPSKRSAAGWPTAATRSSSTAATADGDDAPAAATWACSWCTCRPPASARWRRSATPRCPSAHLLAPPGRRRVRLQRRERAAAAGAARRPDPGRHARRRPGVEARQVGRRRPALLPHGRGAGRALVGRPDRRRGGHRRLLPRASSARRPTLLTYGAPLHRRRAPTGWPSSASSRGGYHLVVARFEPENHVDVIVEGYRRSAARPSRWSSSARRRTPTSTPPGCTPRPTTGSLPRRGLGPGAARPAVRATLHLPARALGRRHQPLAAARHRRRRRRRWPSTSTSTARCSADAGRYFAAADGRRRAGRGRRGRPGRRAARAARGPASWPRATTGTTSPTRYEDLCPAARPPVRSPGSGARGAGVAVRSGRRARTTGRAAGRPRRRRRRDRGDRRDPSPARSPDGRGLRVVRPDAGAAGRRAEGRPGRARVLAVREPPLAGGPRGGAPTTPGSPRTPSPAISAVCTGSGHRAAGAASRRPGGVGRRRRCLLVVGYAFDAADGQLARLRGGGIIAGEWLDHMVDAIKVASLHLAVLVGLYRFDAVPDVCCWSRWGTAVWTRAVLRDDAQRAAARQAGGDHARHRR